MVPQITARGQIPDRGRIRASLLPDPNGGTRMSVPCATIARMGDGNDDGWPGSPLPAPAGPPEHRERQAGHDRAERDLDTPNCPDCLMRMEAEEAPDGEPYWACTECGLVALA